MKKIIKAFMKGMGSVINLAPAKYSPPSNDGFVEDYSNIRGDFEKVGVFLIKVLGKTEPFNTIDPINDLNIRHSWPRKKD